MLQKYKTLSQPVKASLWFMINNLLRQSIGIITTPIFTRILSESDYGITNVYYSWAGLIGILVTLTLSAGVYNNALLDFKDDADKYTSSILSLSSLSAIIYFIIYLILQTQIQVILNLPPILMYLMFMNFLFEPATSFWMAKQRFDYKYKLSSIINISMSLLTPILAYYAVISFNDNKAIARIISTSSLFMILNIVVFVYIMIKGKKYFSTIYWKYALSFNLPLLPHYLSNQLLNQVDRILIANISGNDKAGIYSVAYNASTAISVIWGSVNGSFVPWTLKKMKDKKYLEIGRATNSIIIVSSVVCFSFIAFVPEIINILAPPAYYEAIWVIPPIVLGIYFNFVATFFANIEFYRKKTKFVMIASIVAALMNLGLNLLLIPFCGYIAAAYTTLFGYIVFASMHYYFMNKIEKNKIYDIKFIIGSSLILITASSIIMLVYNNLIGRYFIILLVMIIAILKRELLFNLIRELKENRG